MSATTIQPYRSNYLMPALEHATVGDAMHAGIVTCQAETPLTRVTQLMARHRVHCVAVMGAFADDPGQLRVWGIVTDLELARAWIRTRIDRTAGSLALAPVVFCEPATPLREAGELMVTRGSPIWSSSSR